MALKISVFYKLFLTVYILKGIYFSLLRYFSKNQIVTKIIFVTTSLPY